MSRVTDFFNRNIRTIPLVIITFSTIVIIALLLFTFMKIESQQTLLVETSVRTEELIEQNKILSRQNSDLLDRTIFLSDRNIYYSKCLAKLFSQYTQTDQPIKIDNILKCESS